MSWQNMSALELGAAIRGGEVSPSQVTARLLARASQGKHNAFITVCEEQAMERARQMEKHLPDSPLAGVPMAVKDNICTKGIPTTCASRMLEGFHPAYDAAVVEALDGAGAILLGKTNMDEFAMGSTGETGCYGSAKNPWDEACSAGGSSSGSAAAVAAGECFYALGSDTGGSIRLPAAFCGVTGMKPTYGTVSRYGLIAHAPSLEQIGPIARTAEDCAAVLDLIRGKDHRDSTSVPCGGSLHAGLKSGVKGLRVGVPMDWLEEDLPKPLRDAVLDMAKALEQRGAVVEHCRLPVLDKAVAAYYVLACAEASSELARYDGVRYGHRGESCADVTALFESSRTEGFGWEVKRRILLGTYVLSAGHYDAYYKKALQVKAQVKAGFDAVFARYDVLLTPVSAATAPELGQAKDALTTYLGDKFTVPVNLAGLPAISVPCGFDERELPIGGQLIGRAFGDQTVLNAAHAFQQETTWHLRHPQGGEG